MKEFKVRQSITERNKGIDIYFKEISKIPSFQTPEEEYECALRAFNGCEDAKEELVMKNIKFVVSVCKQYAGTQAPLLDLINEGNMGLLEAVEKFDPSMGFKFISYAIWYIRKRINKYLSDHARLVRIPNNKINSLRSLKEKMNNMEQINDGVVIIEDLLIEFKDKLSEHELNILISLEAGSVKSLDAPFGDDSDNTLLDVIFNDTIKPTDDLLIKNENKLIVNTMMERLPERQALVLIHHYGLNGENKLNLADIGSKLGISREGVRQLRIKGERTLRKEFIAFADN